MVGGCRGRDAGPRGPDDEDQEGECCYGDEGEGDLV